MNFYECDFNFHQNIKFKCIFENYYQYCKNSIDIVKINYLTNQYQNVFI